MSQIKLVPMGKIKANPLNDRVMDEDAIACLMDSIRYIGLQQPLVIYKADKSDEYVVLSGHKRLAALKKLGKTGLFEVPCNIVDKPFNETDEKEKLAQNNIARRSDEEVKSETYSMYLNWGSMDDNQRKITTERLKKLFMDRNKNNPSYQNDPQKFINNNFRPSLEYIRMTTGLTFANKTFKSYISQMLKGTSESIPEDEDESKDKKKTKAKEKQPETVDLGTILDKAESLAGVISTFKESASKTDYALNWLTSVENELRDMVKALRKEV